MDPTGTKRPLQDPLENEQKPNTKKEAPKHEKMNLSQQGNGKRAQQESTVEQRVYICSIHNVRGHRCKTYKKHMIEKQYWNMHI